MNYNLMIHVDLDDPRLLNIAFDNANNYLKFLHESQEPLEAEVVLLANGPAVKMFEKTEENAEFEKRGADLMARGLSIRLCVNALKKFGVDHDRLWEGCRIIPGGVIEIVKLQNEGFSYLKP